jgi:hypothetical protein
MLTVLRRRVRKLSILLWFSKPVGDGPLSRRCPKGSVYGIINSRLGRATIRLNEKQKLEPIKVKSLECAMRDIPIVTMDVETFSEGGPRAVGWYMEGSYNYMRKNDLNVYYGTDSESPSATTQKALFDLLSIKNRGHAAYLHSFDGSDSAYILPGLIRMKSKYDMRIKPLVNDGRLLEVIVTSGLNEKIPEEHEEGPRGGVPLKRVRVTFRDSLELLPESIICNSLEVGRYKSE